VNRNINRIEYDSEVAQLNLGISQQYVPHQISCFTTVLPLSESTRYNDVVSRLSEIGSLHDNWDGYHAACVSATVIGRATALLNGNVQLAGRLALPDLFPTPHGTLAMEWQQGEGEAVLEVGDNGISGFAKSSPGAATYHITAEADALGPHLSSVIANILMPQKPLAQAFSLVSRGTVDD
jgi:hypothetical protein